MITAQEITDIFDKLGRSNQTTYRHLGLPAEFEGELFLRGAGLRVVDGQVADQVPLVSKRTAALGTLVRLLARLRRDVVGVVVEVDVPLQQLFLPERLVAVLADERLLVRVHQHVRLEVALRDGRVRTQVALETLLALVSLVVQLEKTGVKVSRANVNISKNVSVNITKSRSQDLA